MSKRAFCSGLLGCLVLFTAAVPAKADESASLQKLKDTWAMNNSEFEQARIALDQKLSQYNLSEVDSRTKLAPYKAIRIVDAVRRENDIIELTFNAPATSAQPVKVNVYRQEAGHEYRGVLNRLHTISMVGSHAIENLEIAISLEEKDPQTGLQIIETWSGRNDDLGKTFTINTPVTGKIELARQ